MSRMIAHVYCMPAIGESRITTETIDGVFIVRLYIAGTNCRQLIPQFTRELLDKEIKKFERGSLTPNYIGVFLFICNQINKGIPANRLVDEYSNVILAEPSRANTMLQHNDLRQNSSTINESRQNSIPPPDANFQRAANTVFQNIGQNQTNWQQIVSNLGSAIVDMASRAGRQEVEPRQNTPPNTQIEPSILSLMTQIGQLAGAMATQPNPRNTVVNQNAIQPTTVNQNAVNQSELLSRFIENRSGSVREIIQINELEIPIQSAFPPALPVVGLQQLRHPRQPIPLSIIQRLAVNVNNKIISKKLKYPRFTYSKRKKIKNFIHQHTNIWLSVNEINIFIEELSKINSALVM